MIKHQLSKVSGRVFWNGRGDCFVNQPLGRNTIAAVPHQVAETLGLANPKNYTFHSFRRSSATAAADQGATAQQLQDFYGWKNSSMAQEYVSTSKIALSTIAKSLAGEMSKDNNIDVSLNNESTESKSESEPPVANFNLTLPEPVQLQQMMNNNQIEKIVFIQNVQTFNM